MEPPLSLPNLAGFNLPKGPQVITINTDFSLAAIGPEPFGSAENRATWSCELRQSPQILEAEKIHALDLPSIVRIL
jgi:hypothetical protein